MSKDSNALNIQTEIDDDLLNLSKFGVCRSDNAGTLLEQGYLTGGSKWFKPIVGAVDNFILTAKAKERILSLEIDALSDTSDTDLYLDPFTQVDWTKDNYNSLIFTPARIMAEIVNGNSEQVAKSSLGQTWMTAKLGQEGPERTSESDTPSQEASDD